MLHWPGSYPIRETMRAMEKLVSEGAIRCIGVSNFDVEDLIAAERALRNEPMACNQVLYHFSTAASSVDCCPTAPGATSPSSAMLPFGHGNFPAPHSVGGRLLAAIGARHERTARQVALNFFTRHPSVFTIPKTVHPERVWKMPAAPVGA